MTALLLLAGLLGQAGFRTEADPDPALPWYVPRSGTFPPEGTARAYAGELFQADPLGRRGRLRADRTDAQTRGEWDRPVAFTLLPYGSIAYHGAPAALRDVPIGTHLHGLFYRSSPEAPKRGKAKAVESGAFEAEFDLVLRLEDDFSRDTRLNRTWRVDAVDLAAGTLTATGVQGATADPKPQVFHVLPSTRVWTGSGFGRLADLAPGQRVLVNLTWATLFGPGRCTDVWLDAESRALASARQLEVHRQHQRDRGLAGLVQAVDNPARRVTVELLGGIDPGLAEEFKVGASAAAAVAEPSLLTYDPVNDTKSGRVVEVKRVPALPGSLGVQVVFAPSQLLEGFRPGRIVRLFPEGWKVQNPPSEERLFPERD